MAECDNCGDDVDRVWKHRVRDDCMTHRRTRRVCASCHPFLSRKLDADGPAEAGETAGAAPADPAR